MSEQGAAKNEGKDPKAQLEKVADPKPPQAPPPPEVELEELDFLRMQTRRLKVSEQATYLQGVEATLQREREKLGELRDQMVDYEKALSERLGLPIPLTAYTLDERRGVAVLQQQQRGMSPEMMQKMLEAQQKAAAAAEARKKE